MQAGTPAFQPPEQIKGEMCGPGSDVYALGCIATEIFGNRPVWAGLAPHTVILKVASGNFPDVKHLPKNIQAITKLFCRCPIKSLCSDAAEELLYAYPVLTC